MGGGKGWGRGGKIGEKLGPQVLSFGGQTGFSSGIFFERTMKEKNPRGRGNCFGVIGLFRGVASSILGRYKGRF